MHMLLPIGVDEMVDPLITTCMPAYNLNYASFVDYIHVLLQYIESTQKVIYLN